MRIGGCTFLNRNILLHNDCEFVGMYGGRTIYISTDHGLGQPSVNRLKRFQIDVVTNVGNTFEFQDWKDYGSIKKAITYALKGANLYKPKPKKKYRKKIKSQK